MHRHRELGISQQQRRGHGSVEQQQRIVGDLRGGERGWEGIRACAASTVVRAWLDQTAAAHRVGDLRGGGGDLD